MDAKSAGSRSPSPSAAASREPAATRRGTPPAAEVSPGDGAFSPPKSDVNQDRRAENSGNKNGAGDDVGFGPPPAFPSRSKSTGKRKRTLMAVSAPATGVVVNGTPLEDLSSDDDDYEEGDAVGAAGGKKHQSQVIHRIKAGSEAKSPEKEETEKYNDAMLLASLSDVDSPKKKEELSPVDAATVTNAVAQMDRREETARQEKLRTPPRSSNSSGCTASTAATPLRSNVNPDPTTVAKPFPLQPKPQGLNHHNPFPTPKRAKYNENNTLTVVAPAPQSPDDRDPKAVKIKKEGAREGYAPQQPHLTQQPPGASYPPGYHPGYSYPNHQPGAPSPYGASGHPAYPPGYPYHISAYPPHVPPHGPPGSVMGHPSPYPPRAYYPGQHPQSQVPSPSHGAGQGGPIPERWGHYHSPKHDCKPTVGAGPELVHSNSEQPLYHPNNRQSHVVPSEDGDAVAQRAYGRGPPPYGASGPPPAQGYPADSRYGRPPSTRDGYYPAGGPPPTEYAAISRDECSPPRSSQSLHPEYPPAVNTPPRGHYDYYHEQQAGAGAPPGYSPARGQGGYHPGTPPESSYPHPSHTHYSRGGPPPAHEPYEPFDYMAPSPNEAHYHVPTAVSNETESSHHAVPVPPTGPPSSPSSAQMKYHQFRKGGRTIHSEPIILRKKFSWRNYPELEEYLIANRSDYLRHSALNYTAEQKHFNNRLTEGLLELAAKLNYVFDETCFNFVAVRDRIRCYYKSYVQSSKKRGVVVGFSKPSGKNEHEHDQHNGVMGEA